MYALQYHFVTVTKYCADILTDERLERVAEIAHEIAEDFETDIKIATTIGLYVLGEISLGKAAERISVTRWEMEEILSEADIEVRLGPKTWRTSKTRSIQHSTSNERIVFAAGLSRRNSVE